MEHLLRLSGLLDDEDGETDLGALEKKLAEKKNQQSPHASAQGTSTPTSPSQAASAPDGSHTSPRSNFTSPEPGKGNEKDKDEKRKSVTPAEEQPNEKEVEALSDMMCSLVTNQSGETRYIGKSCSCQYRRFATNDNRVVIWLFHLLPERHFLGERKDWRRVVPAHDLGGVCRRP